nr:hypothetical protein [Aneurinibacillus sp. XH2]
MKIAKEKPYTIQQLRDIYEAGLRDMIAERDRQIANLRAKLEDTPEWDEDQAESAYTTAIQLRHLFDPDLKQAFRWATCVETENPKARRLLQALHYRHTRVIEILWEWKSTTLLAFNIIGWNVAAERLIDLWLNSVEG